MSVSRLLLNGTPMEGTHRDVIVPLPSWSPTGMTVACGLARPPALFGSEVGWLEVRYCEGVGEGSCEGGGCESDAGGDEGDVPRVGAVEVEACLAEEVSGEGSDEGGKGDGYCDGEADGPELCAAEDGSGDADCKEVGVEFAAFDCSVGGGDDDGSESDGEGGDGACGDER